MRNIRWEKIGLVGALGCALLMSWRIGGGGEALGAEAAAETSPAADPAGDVKAEFVGAQQCASCHDKVAKKFDRTAHGRHATDKDAGSGEGCESCHGPGSLHVQGGGDPGKIIRKPVETCFKCHSDKKMELSLMYRHPVLDGKMSCSDCHQVHEAQHKTTALKKQQEICLRCHQEKKGPFVFEHEPVAREGCTVCHAPHGSANPKMVVERDFNLCLKCHFAGATFQAVGHYIHRRAMNPAQVGSQYANCTGCHRATHGSNFSKELRLE